MSTAAIIERNRANAQHSSGPKTEEGKAASSRNARKHGLTGKLLLATEAENEKFAQTVAAYRKRYNVDDPSVEPLIQEIAGAAVRMEQIRIVEQHALAEICNQYDDEGDPARLVALAYLRDRENGNVLAKFHRYRTAAQRTFFRCLALLDKLMAASENVEAQPVRNEPKSAVPIDINNLPSFPKDPGKLHIDVPPHILDLVRDPRGRKC